jgi:RHS repeat-associated protein
MWGRLTSQRSSAGVSSFYVPDMSGNMRLLVASDGVTVTDTYAYRAFGDSLNVTGSTNNPYRYGGRDGYYYEKLALEYVRARWRDIVKAGWISRDPTRTHDRGDLNLYMYVGNNPVILVDPGGLFPILPMCLCKPGEQLVSVTCYGKGVGGGKVYHCGKARPPRDGDCAIDQLPGHTQVCAYGATITIRNIGPNGAVVKTCRACDAGQGHSGVDVFVNVPDADCGNYWETAQYCVSCS